MSDTAWRNWGHRTPVLALTYENTSDSNNDYTGNREHSHTTEHHIQCWGRFTRFATVEEVVGAGADPEHA